MEFFKNFPRVDYKFGDEFEKIGGGDAIFEITHDLGAYVDIIDAIRQNSSYYSKYTILENDRPDVVSQKIYGTPAYHWTFFIVNDKLREFGWPLTYIELEKKVKRDFPHKYIETRSDLTSTFLTEETAVGSTSGASGKIIRRNLDTGIIFVDSQRSFTTGETVTNATYSGITTSITAVATGEEYNAPRHYTDGDGKQVDIDPAVGPGALLTEVTYYDYYVQQNEELKTINVIRPDTINEIASLYFRGLKEV